jgi:hypothetical protein
MNDPALGILVDLGDQGTNIGPILLFGAGDCLVHLAQTRANTAIAK